MTKFMQSLIQSTLAQQLQQYWIGDENQGANIDVMAFVQSEFTKPRFAKNPAAQALLSEIAEWDATNDGLKYAKPLAAVVRKSVIAKVTAHIKA